MGNLKLNKETKASRYLISIPEASQRYGIGRDKLYELVRSDPTLPVISIGSIKKINTSMFEEYLDNLTREGKSI